jgi:hypothetical protein
MRLDDGAAIVYSVGAARTRGRMNPIVATTLIAATLVAAIALGRLVRTRVPEHHLSADAKDTIKFAMGMIATMTALLLGLLVSSAKRNYDDQRSHVIAMAAKVVFLERLLALYGPEAEDVRHGVRGIVADAIRRIWPADARSAAELAPNEDAGNAVLLGLQRLTPSDDGRRTLKHQATTLLIDLGQMRTLLQAQAVPSVSPPMLVAVAIWLVMIFATASMLAPPNATTLCALAAAALSVAVAVFLILELDQPFTGLLRISNAPIEAALRQMTP